MTIEAKIIADSISEAGKRLTTFVLKYPRFIHSEIMTHKMISKSASSSRAIPVEKIINQVLEDPAMPVYWGKQQKGMQANEELSLEDQRLAITYWLIGRDRAVETARAMVNLGVHKQIANRVLEPWHHITVVATATEFNNLFGLRCHKDAQPEFQALAMQMARVYIASQPIVRQAGDWHLPFVRDDEREQYPVEQLLAFSAARCARVSYQNHDGSNPNIAKDLELHDRLLKSRPMHASVAEHQGKPFFDPTKSSGNLIGWQQYRKTLQNENIEEFPWEYFMTSTEATK